MTKGYIVTLYRVGLTSRSSKMELCTNPHKWPKINGYSNWGYFTPKEVEILLAPTYNCCLGQPCTNSCSVAFKIVNTTTPQLAICRFLAISDSEGCKICKHATGKHENFQWYSWVDGWNEILTNYLKNGYESNVGKRGQQINQTNPSLLLYQPDLKLTYLHW